jgi:hypothetical protein
VSTQHKPSGSAVLRAKDSCRGPFGHCLHGVAHLLRQEDWAAVQKEEGVGNVDFG